jgi:hypothetical protein
MGRDGDHSGCVTVAARIGEGNVVGGEQSAIVVRVTADTREQSTVAVCEQCDCGALLTSETVGFGAGGRRRGDDLDGSGGASIDKCSTPHDEESDQSSSNECQRQVSCRRCCCIGHHGGMLLGHAGESREEHCLPSIWMAKCRYTIDLGF